MELGEEWLDGEHAAQIRYLETFERALREGGDGHDMVIAFGRLVDFTSLHFLSEQVLMHQRNYPDFERHSAEHDRLLAELRRMQEAFASGGCVMTADEVAALRRNLTDHMASLDKDFVHFLQQE